MSEIALAVIAAILAGWALHATASVVVPVVFSTFLALLVAPLDRWTARHAPRRAAWIGHLVAMGVILIVLLILGGMIWMAAQQVMDRYPMRSGAAGLDFPDLGGASAAQADAGRDWYALAEEALGELGDRLTQWASRHATNMLAAAGAALGTGVLIFFLTLIMLTEGPTWRRKAETLLAPSWNGEDQDVVGAIARRLRRYLLVRTFIGVLTAALYVAWLWFFGVDLLVVWALLALVLNYVPTLGSLIAGVLPVAYAFVQYDVGTTVGVAAGLLVIEQVMGNYVDPRLQGRQLSISSLVVLITLLFWGWVWGIVGMILAVPITISIIVIGSQVHALRPIALLLSDVTDWSGLDRAVSGDDE